MMNVARSACNVILSDQDLANISMVETERNQQRLRKVADIQKRNQERADKLKNKRDDLETFDWSQVIYIIYYMLYITYFFLHFLFHFSNLLASSLFLKFFF